MNNPNGVFDPLLTASYFQQLAAKAEEVGRKKIEPGQLLYVLNQPAKNSQTVSYAFDLIIHNLRRVKQKYTSYFIEYTDKETLGLLQVSRISPLKKTLSNNENHLLVLEQTAVIQLTQATWLKGISQTFSSQSTLALKVMSIYQQLTTAGQEKVDLTDSFCALLIELGIQKPDLASFSYSQQQGVISEIIDFSSIQLAFCLFPRVFFPEILGFTLACCQMKSLFELCFPEQPLSTDFFKRRNNYFKRQAKPVEQCIAIYLELFPEQKEIIWLRIQQGFWLYFQQMQLCTTQLESSLTKPKSVSIQIAELIQKKASAAMGHHRHVQLAGQSLDSWFSGLPENRHELLDALKQSRYIDTKSSDNSLILKLFDFNGPMFGVLKKNEFTVLKNWLKTGLNESLESHGASITKPATEVTLKDNPLEEGYEYYKKLTNRGLYYHLINVDLYPDVLPLAKAKADKLLRACCLFNSIPFKQYSHPLFEHYIDKIYQQEMNAYKPLKGKPSISKVAYLWGLEQIAPMILIDGCWLQRSLDLQQYYPEMSKILFSIYADELGNSILEQNHPFIFQTLLDGLSIDLPEVYKKQFIEHTGFIDSAFDLPVYMLSLSNHSVQFLPELLGLNMAIELSGLGQHYMSLVDDWNYWGIDPTIASIHISIDNIASGHTFLAKKAIQNYLDEILMKTADPKKVDQYWRRIYTGYCSLRFVASRFKYAVPIGYFFNKYNNKKSG